MEIIKGEYKLYLMFADLKLFVEKTEIIDEKEVITTYSGPIMEEYISYMASLGDRLSEISIRCENKQGMDVLYVFFGTGYYYIKCFKDMICKRQSHLENTIEEIKKTVSTITKTVEETKCAILNIGDQIKELREQQELLKTTFENKMDKNTESINKITRLISENSKVLHDIKVEVAGSVRF